MLLPIFENVGITGMNGTSPAKYNVSLIIQEIREMFRNPTPVNDCLKMLPRFNLPVVRSAIFRKQL